MPLPAPTFNGVALFGPVVQLNGFVLPRASQRASIAGVDGLAHRDLGFRGYQTDVRGMIFANSSAGLRAAVALAESYRDGRPYTLIDGYGTAWPLVLLDDYRAEPTKGVDGRWGFWQMISATLLHLAYPT